MKKKRKNRASEDGLESEPATSEKSRTLQEKY